MHSEDAERVDAAIDELTELYRDRCLWHLRSDFYPTSPAARARVLDQIQRHGDRAAFRRAAELRACLSRMTSASSAAS